MDMEGEILLSQRLRKLREEKGLSQKDLAKHLSLFMGRDKNISVSAVCSWELGAKKPPYETLLGFSDFYGVSTDYLLGKTSNRSGNNDARIFDLEDYIIKITEEQLKANFANKPVYLVFKNSAISNRWGIYNKENDRFCCAENIVVNSPSIEYYAVTPESLPNFNSMKNNISISLDEAKKCDQVWIEYENPSEDLRSRFSGWYHVDTKSSVFLASSGFALPFDSIDVIYHVYKKKPNLF